MRPPDRAGDAGQKLHRPVIAADVLQLVSQRAAQRVVVPLARGERQDDRLPPEAEGDRNRDLGGEDDEHGAADAALARHGGRQARAVEPNLPPRRPAAETDDAGGKESEHEERAGGIHLYPRRAGALARCRRALRPGAWYRRSGRRGGAHGGCGRGLP